MYEPAIVNSVKATKGETMTTHDYECGREKAN